MKLSTGGFEAQESYEGGLSLGFTTPWADFSGGAALNGNVDLSRYAWSDVNGDGILDGVALARSMHPRITALPANPRPGKTYLIHHEANCFIVRVFKSEGSPQMMAHKLTSAVFPQKDKLIRNMMGILTEAQIGNPFTFPMCGFGSDEWVLALLEMKSYIPLSELGPDHESWGMKDAGGGRLSVFDKAKQHKAYAETGSLGNYMFETYGINKIKQFQRLSQEKERPWKDVFGISMQELESHWLKTLRANKKTREENVSIVLKLLERNPGTACSEAQKLVNRKK